MKVIFLDVDGVLNSEPFLENNTESIDGNNVSKLKSALDITNAVIVMSSGWRLLFNDNMLPESGDSQYLYDILCNFGIELFGKTPDFSTEEIRIAKTFSLVKALEILAWLDAHDPVENYVVLDDLDLNNEVIHAHQVRTNPQLGLTEEDTAQIVRMLNL